MMRGHGIVAEPIGKLVVQIAAELASGLANEESS